MKSPVLFLATLVAVFCGVLGYQFSHRVGNGSSVVSKVEVLRSLEHSEIPHSDQDHLQSQFRYFSYCDQKEKDLCVQGKLATGTAITLLPNSLGSSAVCVGKAGQVRERDFYTEGDKDFTTVIHDCKFGESISKFPVPFVILGEKVNSFEWDKMPGKSTTIDSSVPAEIRRQEVKDAFGTNTKEAERFFSLGRFAVLGEDISFYLVEYDLKSKFADMPNEKMKISRYFYQLDGVIRPMPMREDCPDALQGFQLNGIHYWHVYENCCDCGRRIHRIMEFDGKQIQTVYEDWTEAT